jgi:plastocyanin
MVARSSLAFPLRWSLFLVALAAAGCGEEPAPSAPAPEAPAASEASEPASAPAPSSGGRRGAAAATTTGEEPYESLELGALHGTIRFEGKAPERFPLGAAASNECKHHPEVDQLSNVVLVEDGMLANVFVTLDSGYDRAKVPPAPAESVTLEQKGCMYVPRVLALRAGQTLRVSNDDPTTHNVHTRAKRNAELNRNMGAGQAALEFTFDKPERPVPFQCDIHPWMGAAVFVEEHPWFAVSDAAGRFRIRDVPPGNYEVEAIHETLGKVSGKVTVKAGSSTGITLTLQKK